MIATPTTRKAAADLRTGDVVAAQDAVTLGVVMGQAGLAQEGGIVLWIDRADRAVDAPLAVVRYAADETVVLYGIAQWQEWNGAQEWRGGY